MGAPYIYDISTLIVKRSYIKEHFLSFLAEFFLGLEMFQTKVVEEIKTHFMFNIVSFRRKL